jgi:hypothetical protein
MKYWSRVLCLVLLLALGVNAGYGWGSVTHVYFAKQLGTKVGMANLNEMYGAVLPDFLGSQFSMPKQEVDYLLHTNRSLMYGFYGAASSFQARAVFFGYFTHNNNEELKGADWYAHGVYPGSEQGWVIREGVKLISDPDVAGYIAQLVGPGNVELFGPALGHNLIESAVDILVRRCEDPLVGARLYLAAKSRSDEAAAVLSNGLVVATGVDLGYAQDEALYREQMMQYGQLFLLPEGKLIGQLSQLTASLAEQYVAFVSGGQMNVHVEPTVMAQFIRKAIQQVTPIYHKELAATLTRVQNNMRLYHLVPAYPLYACFGKDAVEEEVEALASSANLLPTNFTLNQNYPNPFNPSTTVSYALPSDVPVTLKVYNSIGQEVATLVDGLQPAGVHQAVWDAKGLPSGVYIYRLNAGTFVETKKMTLMK